MHVFVDICTTLSFDAMACHLTTLNSATCLRNGSSVSLSSLNTTPTQFMAHAMPVPKLQETHHVVLHCGWEGDTWSADSMHFRI